MTQHTVDPQPSPLSNLSALSAGADARKPEAGAVDSSGGISEKLDNLTQLLYRMDQKMGALDAKMNSLQIQITADRWNTSARLMNSISGYPEVELIPPVNVQTGEEIPGAPRTFMEILALTSSGADEYLRELDVFVSGDVAEKRERVFLEFGITKLPVNVLRNIN